MCLLVNTYQSCALFGHPIEQANAKGFETVLCDNAKRGTGRSAEMCGNVSARNIPIFAHPYCMECDKIDAELFAVVVATLEANEMVDDTTSPRREIITKEFVQKLRGLPIDLNRAPAISCEGMLEFLRRGVRVPVSETEAARADAWKLAQRRKNGTRTVGPEVKRELFVRWLLAACKIRHVAVAMDLAKREDDGHREALLELLLTHAKVVSIYRARLTQLSSFERYLGLAGISESELSDSSSEDGTTPGESDADFCTDER